MKVVDRKTFLQMPEGTVFCKLPLFDKGNSSSSKLPLSLESVSILGYKSEKDFECQQIGDMTAKDEQMYGSGVDPLLELVDNLGKSIPMEHWSGRDGLYEGDEVGFAIYSRQEVEEMIHLLQEALENGYKKE